MNKNLIIAILGLALIGGGFFIWQSKKNSAPQNGAAATPAAQTDTQTQIQNSPRTLRDLLGLGASQKCTFSTTMKSYQNEGTVFISNGKMRGDFTSRVDAAGKTVLSHMITDGKESRVWQDGETTGFLMAVPEKNASPTPAATPGGDQAPSYDTQTNYSCTPWTADESVFTPPATIAFRSVADMMKMGAPQSDGGMGQGMEVSKTAGAASGGSAPATPADAKALQCSACAQVADPSQQAKCKAAFQCE